MSKCKRKSRFQAQSATKNRTANTRQERPVKEELPLMQFSFKDFRGNQQGQTFQGWEKELLASLMDKCIAICNCNRIEAEQQKYIKVYGKFSTKSGFENPFPDAEGLQWAVIMNIGGQKARVVGYVDGNIFYVVFLDAEHQFYPSSKKNT